MTKIKICGLTRIEDILAVNTFLPDYVGFVFAPGRRQIDYETGKQLKRHLNPAIKAVGVFVNEKIDLIAHLYENRIIDLVQLHGDETKEDINALKKLISCPVIKAVRVRESQDIIKASPLPCDYILLDTYQEGQYGGSGISFDWSLAQGMNKPFFLAGGIHSGNITKAMELTHAYCIDVSSGVETKGYKDPDKIKEVIGLIRNYKGKD